LRLSPLITVTCAPRDTTMFLGVRPLAVIVTVVVATGGVSSLGSVGESLLQADATASAAAAPTARSARDQFVAIGVSLKRTCARY
jgi:hypothetical protein